MKLKRFIWMPVLFSMTASYAQTKQQTENLYTFTRLYGYVRYFHPSDANVVLDWDKFAIYGAQQVDKAQNQEELLQTLQQLFKPIAPSMRIYHAGKVSMQPPLNIRPADTTGMLPVSWQHNGYGAGSNNTTYRSIRTNSYIKQLPPTQQSIFSGIAGFLDAKPYQGRMIRYTAAIKADDLSYGKGQLWLRVNKPDQKIGLFDNMDNRAVTGVKKDWHRDTIMGKIDDDAQGISYGCLIVGNGKMYIDDVKLEIQTDNGWQSVPGFNGNFESDTLPGNWQTNPEDRIFNIRTTSEQAVSGKQSLFMDRGSLSRFQKTTTLFPNEVLPAGTVIHKNIGSMLAIDMPVALWGDGQKTYPLTDTAQILQLNNTMAASLPSNYTANDLYVRLADIIITWNVFQHFHPYYKEWKTNWDLELRTAINRCYLNKTEEDFNITFRKMTATMRDGHTYISTPMPVPLAYLPVAFEWVEDNLVVTDVMSPNVQLQVGDVVFRINNMTTKAFLDSVQKLPSAGSPDALMAATLRDIQLGKKDSLLHLEGYRSVKTTHWKENVPYNMGSAEFYQKSEKKPEGFRYIDSNRIYVNMSTMNWKDLQPKLPELAKAKVVIFDLRGYPNGEMGTNIIGLLLSKPENNKWMQMQRLSLPDHENVRWDSMGWNVQPAIPHIGGKVFFLTNSRAVSYAESVMGYIKDLKLATIVGSMTAGANGDINYVPLPGGYQFSFTGLKATHHNGAQHFMIGIQPDVTVYKTIKGIKEGKDEVLEKAISLSK